MKLIKYLILLAFIGSAVLVIGMITQGWTVGGHTWEEVSKQFLPTKKAWEKRQDKVFKNAEQEADAPGDRAL
jgi:hypothetical protein